MRNHRVWCAPAARTTPATALVGPAGGEAAAMPGRMGINGLTVNDDGSVVDNVTLPGSPDQWRDNAFETTGGNGDNDYLRGLASADRGAFPGQGDAPGGVERA